MHHDELHAKIHQLGHHAEEISARKQAEQKTLEERVAQLEEPLARLGG